MFGIKNSNHAFYNFLCGCGGFLSSAFFGSWYWMKHWYMFNSPFFNGYKWHDVPNHLFSLIAGFAGFFAGLYIGPRRAWRYAKYSYRLGKVINDSDGHYLNRREYRDMPNYSYDTFIVQANSGFHIRAKASELYSILINRIFLYVHSFSDESTLGQVEFNGKMIIKNINSQEQLEMILKQLSSTNHAQGIKQLTLELKDEIPEDVYLPDSFQSFTSLEKLNLVGDFKQPIKHTQSISEAALPISLANRPNLKITHKKNDDAERKTLKTDTLTEQCTHKKMEKTFNSEFDKLDDNDKGWNYYYIKTPLTSKERISFFDRPGFNVSRMTSVYIFKDKDNDNIFVYHPFRSVNTPKNNNLCTEPRESKDYSGFEIIQSDKTNELYDLFAFENNDIMNSDDIDNALSFIETEELHDDVKLEMMKFMKANTNVPSQELLQNPDLLPLFKSYLFQENPYDNLGNEQNNRENDEYTWHDYTNFCCT